MQYDHTEVDNPAGKLQISESIQQMASYPPAAAIQGLVRNTLRNRLTIAQLEAALLQCHAAALGDIPSKELALRPVASVALEVTQTIADLKTKLADVEQKYQQLQDLARSVS